jgi:hypothetical protein
MADERRTYSDTRSLRAEMMLAEYHSLRREIGRFQNHQKDIMNVAAGTLLALAAPAAAAEGHREIALAILFFIPWIYMLLAGAYTDRTLKILLPAGYIHRELRPKVNKLVDGEVWDWENYKRSPGDVDRHVFWAMDKFRWLVFVIPALLGSAAFIYLSWPQSRTDALSASSAIAIALTQLPVAIAFYVMFVADEGTGVFGACETYFRPEPLSGWIGAATIVIPALLILQFLASPWFSANHVALGVSLAVCSFGFGLGALELIYYRNYRLQTDGESAYMVGVFGHTRKWKREGLDIQCQPRPSKWLPLTIEISGVEEGDAQRRQRTRKFLAVGGNLEQWEEKVGTWQTVAVQAGADAVQQAEAIDAALRRGLHGLASHRR